MPKETTEEGPLDSENYLSEYRQWLVAAEQKSQEAFDKTVLSLSGGALGISFIFLRDVIGSDLVIRPHFLLAAWLSWAFSSFAVLVSFFLSHLALRRAIVQVDSGDIAGLEKLAGGIFSKITALFNASGAILFLVGVCSITVFAHANLSAPGTQNVERKNAESSCAEATSPETNPAKTKPSSP